MVDSTNTVETSVARCSYYEFENSDEKENSPN